MNCSTGTKYGKANSHIFASYYCKDTGNKIKHSKERSCQKVKSQNNSTGMSVLFTQLT
jgi:putative hemolysin